MCLDFGMINKLETSLWNREGELCLIMTIKKNNGEAKNIYEINKIEIGNKKYLNIWLRKKGNFSI